MKLLLALALLLTACPHPTPDPVYPVDADAGADNTVAVPCPTYSGTYQVMDTVVRIESETSTCKALSTSDVLTVSVAPDQDPDSGQWDVIVFGSMSGTYHGLAAAAPGVRKACRFVVELPESPAGLRVTARDFIIGDGADGKGHGTATVQGNDGCVWASSSVLQESP
jgi:hypothetical protein